MATRYRDAHFAQAITRGDGVIGEEVTENARTIRSLPLRRHATRSTRFEVRGEEVMNRLAFERLNADRDERGLSRFANPRNAAAGSLRVLEPSITASRRLDFYAYFLLVNGHPSFPASGRRSNGSPHGFKVNNSAGCVRTFDEVLEFCREWEKSGNNFPTKSTAWS